MGPDGRTTRKPARSISPTDSATRTTRDAAFSRTPSLCFDGPDHSLVCLLLLWAEERRPRAEGGFDPIWRRRQPRNASQDPGPIWVAKIGRLEDHGTIASKLRNEAVVLTCSYRGPLGPDSGGSQGHSTTAHRRPFRPSPPRQSFGGSFEGACPAWDAVQASPREADSEPDRAHRFAFDPFGTVLGEASALARPASSPKATKKSCHSVSKRRFREGEHDAFSYRVGALAPPTGLGVVT